MWESKFEMTLRRSTPFLMSGAIVVFAVACTHDFDAFESASSGDGGSAGSDASSSDAASGNDGGTSGDSGSGTDSGVKDAGKDAGPVCIPPADCADAAASCGSACNQTEFTCESACHNPGRAQCQADCRDAGGQCTGGCIATCVTCAGCNALAACTTATN